MTASRCLTKSLIRLCVQSKSYILKHITFQKYVKLTIDISPSYIFTESSVCVFVCLCICMCVQIYREIKTWKIFWPWCFFIYFCFLNSGNHDLLSFQGFRRWIYCKVFSVLKECACQHKPENRNLKISVKFSEESCFLWYYYLHRTEAVFQRVIYKIGVLESACARISFLEKVLFRKREDF